MYRKYVIMALVAGVAAFAPNAYAFGIGDIVSFGIQAGGKVIGAAVDAGIDKAKDAMRDPEAEAVKMQEEERRVAEQFQKAQAAIEVRHDLSPLQRERLSLTLKKQYAQMHQFKQFVEMAEARQKAERNQIFTGAGLLGVVGDAAINTPSVALARADAMAHSPIYRAQMRTQSEAAFRQADAAVAAGIPQAQSRAALAQADAVTKGGIPLMELKEILRPADVERGAEMAEAAGMSSPSAPQAGGKAETQPVSENKATGAAADAFSPDIGKKIYVEFQDSPTQTRKLRDALVARGHALADKREDADVVYLIDGEYVVPENKQYQGVRLSAGNLLENPDKLIPVPEKKLMGSIGSGVGTLFLVMAAAQGAKVPQGAMPKEQTGFSQEALLVIARQPKNGAETRLSVMKNTDSLVMAGASLVKDADEEMLVRLGIGGFTAVRQD